MKKIVLSALLLCGAATTFGQCDKQTVLTSSKTEYLDNSGNVEHSADEKTTVEVFKDRIIVAPGSAPAPMTGPISSHTCNWTVPYKEGKSVIKAKITDEGGNPLNLTLTIEGKDGKLTLLAQIEEMPERQIRVPIDTYKEKS